VLEAEASMHGRSAKQSGRPARLLFLPPYSPDLNPIEQVFAKLKTLLRKAEERTLEAVWRRIGTLLEMFSPQSAPTISTMRAIVPLKPDAL